MVHVNVCDPVGGDGGSVRNIFVVAIYASVLKPPTAWVKMGQNSPQRTCGSGNERKTGLFLDSLTRGIWARQRVLPRRFRIMVT